MVGGAGEATAKFLVTEVLTALIADDEVLHQLRLHLLEHCLLTGSPAVGTGRTTADLPLAILVAVWCQPRQGLSPPQPFCRPPLSHCSCSAWRETWGFLWVPFSHPPP